MRANFQSFKQTFGKFVTRAKSDHPSFRSAGMEHRLCSTVKFVRFVCEHVCACARAQVCELFPAVLSTPDAVTHFRNESVVFLLVGEEAAWESQQHLDNAVSGVHCLATSPPHTHTHTPQPAPE